MEYADFIEKLPSDKENPTDEELSIINSIFIEDQNTIEKIFNEIKDILIIFILFILLSLSKTTEIINLYVPITKTKEWYILVFKGIILSISFWLIKNMYLAKTL
jgi:hypothetical protein